jgi:hypothetical protein
MLSKPGMRKPPYASGLVESIGNGTWAGLSSTEYTQQDAYLVYAEQAAAERQLTSGHLS